MPGGCEWALQVVRRGPWQRWELVAHHLPCWEHMTWVDTKWQLCGGGDDVQHWRSAATWIRHIMEAVVGLGKGVECLQLSMSSLCEYIAALKDRVIFPLLYPEVFERFNIQPPRGCLFYGPPGTEKTLVAYALANECSCGDRKISFPMRKASDCLRQWVGESERQLHLLFE